MELISILKIMLMVVFICEVLIFGRFISALKCFKDGNIMSIAMTFSGMLFLSIALLDIILEAIANFYLQFNNFSKHVSFSSSLHSNSNLPLTMIIAMFTFLIIMYIDKILIGHSHDHEYEVSFASEPRRSNRDQFNPVEMKEMGRKSRVKITSEEIQEKEMNLRPFILQLGILIRDFFECLTVGLQKTTLGVFGLASAIVVVDEWAEGLTNGLIYCKQNYSKKITNIMIIFQANSNVAGLLVGNQGVF